MNHIEIKRRQTQLFALALGLGVIMMLGKSIGDNGVAYLAAALESFAFIWVIVGANVPDTLGKIIRGRNAKGQYKNASMLRKSIFFFQGVVGLIGSVLFFVMAQFLAESVLQMPYSKFLIMLLASLIFLRSLSAVLLGAFQGDGSELPATVTCILRPLFLLGFGLLFGRILASYGQKVSNLLGQEAFVSMYGAAGVAIAMVLTEVLILLLLILVYRGSRRNRAKKSGDGMRTTDSFFGQIYVLYGNMGFSLLFSLLLLLPLWIGLVLFQKNASDIYSTANVYGIYVGKYLSVCCAVIALLAAALLPTAAKVSGLLRKDEQRYAKNVFQGGIKACIVYSSFFAVFFTVMSKTLAGAISNTGVNNLSKMFAVGSGIVFLGAIAYYCYVLLKLSGKKFYILLCFVIANLVFAGALWLLLEKGKADIMPLIYAGLIYAGVLAASLCILIFTQLRVRMDWLRTLAIPLGCVCVTGLVSYLLGKALAPHLGNVVTVIVVFVPIWIIYLALIVFLRCFGEQELSMVPGGKILRMLGQLLGVY